GSALSYEDDDALARFGAKVLHRRTMERAAASDIRVRVLNSRRPDEPGTRIDASGAGDTSYAAVASRAGLALLDLTARGREANGSFASRALQALADARVTVIVGEVPKDRPTGAVDGGVKLEALGERASAFADVRVRSGLSAVCAVGGRLASDPRLVTSAFALLDDRRLHLVARPGGSSAIAVVVDDRDVHDLVARLPDSFTSAKPQAVASWASLRPRPPPRRRPLPVRRAASSSRDSARWAGRSRRCCRSRATRRRSSPS